MDHLPDEELMQVLENERGKGSEDCPVRVVWNSMSAGIVFQHAAIESLRRELLRNGQLRRVCGSDITLKVEGVPSSSAYTLLSTRLMKHQRETDGMFNRLVEMLCDELPDFGVRLLHTGGSLKVMRGYGAPGVKRHVMAAEMSTQTLG